MLRDGRRKTYFVIEISHSLYSILVAAPSACSQQRKVSRRRRRRRSIFGS